MSCKVGCNWLCRSLQNNMRLSSCKNCSDGIFGRKNTKNNTFVNYYQCNSWSAILSIIDKHNTETIQWSIQSLIIRHHYDIPISGLISLLLFSLLHNLIVVPSFCRGRQLEFVCSEQFSDSKKGCSFCRSTGSVSDRPEHPVNPASRQ